MKKTIIFALLIAFSISNAHADKKTDRLLIGAAAVGLFSTLFYQNSQNHVEHHSTERYSENNNYTRETHYVPYTYTEHRVYVHRDHGHRDYGHRDHGHRDYGHREHGRRHHGRHHDH